MVFLLNSQNIFDYLNGHHINAQMGKDLTRVKHKIARNFNLLVASSDGRTLLVKQECYEPNGKTAGGFANEWRVQEFLRKFPELSHLRPLISEILHFDSEHSIIISNYFSHYRDLVDFYSQENVFSTPIAAAVGKALAAIHQATLNHSEYRDFFCPQEEDSPVNGGIPHILRKLDRIGPEVFGQVPADGLKFFALYQRYESLRAAIADLTDSLQPCCLTHNDLKLNNILLHQDWENILLAEPRSEESIVRLIDWERCGWGDPAFDLGMLIGSYLLLWLRSLVVSQSIDIQDSLRMAMTPLERLQPSIATLARTYFASLPEILECHPQFLKRAIQCAGLALILQIVATLQHRKTFGNTGICMLQVAKGLLCCPEQYMSTVFGDAASEMTDLCPALA